MGDVFHGKGRVQIAFRDRAALVRIQVASTQTRRIRDMLGNFLRKEVAPISPQAGPVGVHIWTSETVRSGGEVSVLDVDSVAKVCLDAMKGFFWCDDSQIVQLISEKFSGERNCIILRVQALKEGVTPVPLDASLFDL